MEPIFSPPCRPDRKSTRLNSSHLVISYAVFCLKKRELRRASSRVCHRADVPPTALAGRARALGGKKAHGPPRFSSIGRAKRGIAFFFKRRGDPRNPPPSPTRPSAT